MLTRDTSEAGLIELTGEDPMWIWAFTCPTPGCDCRRAVILSTGGDRQELMTRGAPVREAWLRGESHAKAAAALDGVVAFAVDIDGGIVFPAYDENPFAALDFDAHPEAREVADRIDGEILETIGRLWYAGKGWPDPEEKRREAERIELPDWKRGDLVAWGEALVGVRQDVFRLGDRVFEAVDLCCVAQGCSCGEAVLEFAPIAPRGAPPPGAVRIDKSGQATLEPAQERQRERQRTALGGLPEATPQLSGAICTPFGRHAGPGRTDRRRAAHWNRTAKVGRNNPCPCGSGKKYKKCCGVT